MVSITIVLLFQKHPPTSYDDSTGFYVASYVCTFVYYVYTFTSTHACENRIIHIHIHVYISSVELLYG